MIIEPTLNTVAKKLHGVEENRHISPREAEILLEKYFEDPDWDYLVEHLTEEQDEALSAWYRTYLQWN